MLIGRQLADPRESERFAELAAEGDPVGGVLFRGDHDVVCPLKEGVRAVLHAVDLTARHGMGGDELHPLRQHGLDVVHDRALDARDVRDDGPGSEKGAVRRDPFPENVGIEREDDQIRVPDEGGIRFRGGVIDDPLPERIRSGCRIDLDTVDREAPFFQDPGVAASQQAEPHDQDLSFVQRFHMSSTSIPSVPSAS